MTADRSAPDEPCRSRGVTLLEPAARRDASPDKGVGSATSTDARSPGRSHVSGPTRAGLLFHAVLALVAVTGLAVALNRPVPVISDDGSVLAQADLLVHGRLGADLPLPAADRSGEFPPLENSTTAADRYYPYVKHLALPAAVAGFTSLVGPVGAVLFSAWSVWVAGLAAAAIAWRIDRRLAPLALWSTVLLSPLVFDVSLAVATGAAAAVLGFLLVSVLALRERPVWWRWVPVVGLSFLLPLWRTEGVVAVAAVATFVCGEPVLRWIRTRSRPPGTLTGAVAGIVVAAAGAAAFLLDSRIVAEVAGGTDGSVVALPADYDPVAGRLSAVWVSLLRPSDGISRSTALVALAVLLLVVLAASSLRRGSDGRSATRLLVLAAAGSMMFVVVEPSLVTGLVPATPLLLGGLLLLRRQDLVDRTVPACLVVAGLTVLGVVATSYSQGGGAEWGGRYFHLILPLVVPVTLLGLERGRSVIAGRDRTVATVAVAVLAVTPPVLALRNVSSLHEANERTVEVVLDAVARAEADGTRLAGGPAGDGGPPVVVSARPTFGRFAWDRIGGMRLLTVAEPERLSSALRGVAATDVVRIVVLAQDDEEPLRSTLGDWRVVRRDRIGGWQITRMERIRTTG